VRLSPREEARKYGGGGRPRDPARNEAGNEVALGYLLNGDTKQARPAIHQRRSLSNDPPDSAFGTIEL